MDASLVSRMWSVRIQGMDISMGNWILRPMVSSRKNSRNHSWERSQHCCSVSEGHTPKLPVASGGPTDGDRQDAGSSAVSPEPCGSGGERTGSHGA